MRKGRKSAAAAAFYRAGVNLMARNYPLATYKEIALEFGISAQSVYVYLSAETKQLMRSHRNRELFNRSERVWEMFQANPELTYKEIGVSLGVGTHVVATDLAKAYQRRLKKIEDR